MARDRLAAIRAQQRANESNQPRAAAPPQLRGQDRQNYYRDEDELRDFDPRTTSSNAGYGRRSQEQPRSSYEREDFRPYYTSNYQSEPRHELPSRHTRNESVISTTGRGYEDAFYETEANPVPRTRRLSSAVPLTAQPPPRANHGSSAAHGHTYSVYAPEEVPREDFNPLAYSQQQNQFAPPQKSFEGQEAPRGAQRTQYTPTDPVRTHQRSISGSQPEQGWSAPEPYPPLEQAPRQVPPAPGPEPTRGLPARPQEDVTYVEKASTVNLVDGVDEKDADRVQNKKSGPRGPTITAGDVPFEEMGEFFTEVSDLQHAMREVNDSVQKIQQLHGRLLALPSSESPQALAISEDLRALSDSTRAAFNDIKNRIHELDQGNANLRALIPAGLSVYGLELADVDVRDAQVEALKLRFKDSIQQYAEVERDNRAKNKARMQRQIKVVNPSLSAAEVDNMVRKAEEGGGEAIFQQALLRTGRSYAARNALREVETRAAELARIEATLTELAQLFNDMSLMVEAQDVQIVAIEKQAAEVNNDMEVGLNHTKAAVVSARNARKWRWVCFWIILVIILIVLIVVVVEVIVPLVKDRNRRNAEAASNNPPPGTSSAASPPAQTAQQSRASSASQANASVQRSINAALSAAGATNTATAAPANQTA
ncbi:hypothetical protein OIV83_001681 [Microbotryomycetes sp. JL201]|nr:hypothetical protein OIV83_001681 [Microbotryomycetes sp. JL201]